MKRLNKNRIGLALLAIAAVFLPTRLVYAGPADMLISMTSGAIAKVIMSVSAPIGFVASLVFRLAGVLVEWALGMNSTILNLDKNFFLKTGWSTVLNLADLALIVALIVIALATMLNYESYGMKKALPKLIIIAILVNFSLVIPGVLMDLSGMVTAFFVNQSGISDGGVSTALASAFDIAKLFEPRAGGMDVKIPSAVASLSTAVLIPLASVIFAIIFTIIASLILFTIAAMLVIRFIKLSFLLVFAPIIFVAWIFPSTKSHWTKWWNDFVRWTMFAPVMMFFVWLSIASLRQSASAVSSMDGSAALESLNSGLTFQAGALINMVLAIAILMGSLIASNSISISGAKGSKDMIGTMTNSVKGKVEGWGKGTQAYARRESERLARRGGAIATSTAGRRVGETAMAQKLLAREKEGKFGGQLIGAARRGGEQVSKAQRDALKAKFDEKFKGMSDNDLALRYASMGSDEKSFAALKLGGKIGKVNEKILDRDIAEGKASLDMYGGAGTYDKMTKAAGRNAEMVKAKGNKDADDEKIREIENKIDSAMKEPNSGERNARVNKLEAEKSELKKGNYDEVAKKFYESFGRKDFEALGSSFYGKGAYGEAALKSLLAKEPNAFSKIVSGLDKSGDAQAFNDKAVRILETMKKEAIEVIKAKNGSNVEGETNKELLFVMKGMREFNEANAKEMNAAQKMEWIASKDARVHAALGGEKLATSLEQQMKFLIETRKNSVVMGMEGAEDYQKAIRTQSSMRKSMGNRIYAESEKEEEKKTA